MVKWLKFYSENIEGFRTSLKRRGLGEGLIDQIEKLRAKRVGLVPQLDSMRAELNKANPKGVPDGATRERLKQISNEISELEQKTTQIDDSLNELLAKLPNLVAKDSPDGGEADFKELRRWGQIPKIDKPKDHEQLGTDLDLIDFEAGAKVSGTKFYYLKNEAVWLEFALVIYIMNVLKSEDFVPMITPDLVKNDVLEGIGFAPKGPEKQVYGVDENEMSLIGTAEITLGGYHKDEIISSEKLPIKYLGFSTCFRTEAGAYGKHSKGLYRVHQFDKLEMFIFCLPEDGEKMHQYILSLEERIFQELQIPYRVIDIAAGDLGAPAFKKYDIEAWMPGRGDFGEVTSTSNTTNFQSVRLNIKFADGKRKDFLTTLNGTACAVSRTLIAILENYQRGDGSIRVPDVLIPYTGFSEIKPK